MGIFRPAWASKNHQKARKAVEKITNQSVIEDIARNDKDMGVRRGVCAKFGHTFSGKCCVCTRCGEMKHQFENPGGAWGSGDYCECTRCGEKKRHSYNHKALCIYCGLFDPSCRDNR
jgi:predicted DNA binding protein